MPRKLGKSRKKIVVIGAGGCAREVAWTLDDTPGFEFVGFVVTDLARRGAHDSQVLGDIQWLKKNAGAIDGLLMGIGDPVTRLRVATELEHQFPKLDWPVVIHPSVVIDRKSCRFEKGVVFMAGTIATVNLQLEAHVLVHYGCTIGHESRFGRSTVLNPGANISGGVELGESVLVGTGAQVLQYLTIGRSAIIGAGAVVTKNVSPGEVVAGVPARTMKAAKLKATSSNR